MILNEFYLSQNRAMSNSPPRSAQDFDIETLLRDLPRGERWREHLEKDLLPFWTMPSALGEPLGNFPTYRNNDGSLVDPTQLRPELENITPEELNRDYVRAKSRQCFGYGVAYHMTGEEKYLTYAKAGVAFLRENAFDRANGGAYSYFIGPERTPGPGFAHRTSQDLAYLLTGIGFLYYLTRDPDLERELIETHDYIWFNYYDSGADMFCWVLEDSPDKSAKKTQQEIVAQLDQIYSYMMLVTPCLPEPHCSTWKKRLKKLAHILMDRFYCPRTEMFWGVVIEAADKRWGARNTDFGHSAKAFWLISLIGSLTDDYEMFVSAQRRAAQLVDMAYLEGSGSWSSGLKWDGTRDEDKMWWIYCELDQVAGALALNDPAYLRYVVRTYDYWFKFMVDHENHEVWPILSGTTKQPTGFPKIHSWKNALHTFEHALIGYLFAQQLHNKAAELHFAWQQTPQKRRIAPYFYQATVQKIFETTTEAGAKRQTVLFTTVH
jgi:mannose/cellobiose epimerase-like protein (N-acyl-D-glucosamine 2-epimerase family)